MMGILELFAEEPNNCVYMKNLQLVSIVAAAVMAVTGCSKDGGGFKNAWYAEKLYTAEEEEIAHYREIVEMEQQEDDLEYIFDESGIFNPTSKGFVALGTYIPGTSWGPVYCTFIHIVDKRQLNVYEDAILCKDGTSATQNREKVYSLDAKGAIGKVSFYGKPTIYFYEKDGDMITITIGKETEKMVVQSDALLMNGGGRWPKYNQSEIH